MPLRRRKPAQPGSLAAAVAKLMVAGSVLEIAHDRGDIDLDARSSMFPKGIRFIVGLIGDAIDLIDDEMARD